MGDQLQTRHLLQPPIRGLAANLMHRRGGGSFQTQLKRRTIAFGDEIGQWMTRLVVLHERRGAGIPDGDELIVHCDQIGGNTSSMGYTSPLPGDEEAKRG